MTVPQAEVRTGADGARRLEWQRDYPDPVDEVWAAVTEPERLGRWIGTWTGEPRVGGTVAFTMTGEADAGGEVCEPSDVTVVDCVPPRRLVVDMPHDEGGAWRVEVTVEPRGDGSRLVFAQRVVEGMRPEDTEAGWRWYLHRLESSLRGAPMPAWELYAPR